MGWSWRTVTPDEIARGLVGWGLDGARAALPKRPLASREWVDLQAAVTNHRIWGLLGAATASGDLPTSDAQAAQVEVQHRLAMTSVLELEAMAVTTTKRLRQQEIPVRLLKGLAVAHLDEPDVALRCFNDVDLLVPPEQLTRAVATLQSEGYVRDLPERRPGFDRRFAKEATMTGPRGREVDVHRTLALGAFGLAIDLDELWAESDTIVLAGIPHATLDADRRLLHACYGAVLGDPVPRLVLLRDVGLLLTGGRVDTREVRDLAGSWRGEAVLATGICLAAEALGAEGWPLLAWARDLRPSAWSGRALRAYRSQGGTNTRVLLSGAMAPMGLLARTAYVRALFMPSRAYVRARRQTGRPAELRSGLRELYRRR